MGQPNIGPFRPEGDCLPRHPPTDHDQVVHAAVRVSFHQPCQLNATASPAPIFPASSSLAWCVPFFKVYAPTSLHRHQNLVIAVIFGVGETLKHDERVRRRQNSPSMTGDISRTHKSMPLFRFASFQNLLGPADRSTSRSPARHKLE